MTREEAIDYIAEFMVIDDWSLVYMPRLHEALIVAIDALKEDRPHGEWVRYSSTIITCKVCKKNVPDNTAYIPMNFCPICGSKNRWKGGDEK